MDPSTGSGIKLKKRQIEESEVYLTQLWKICQKDFQLTDISQLAEAVKNKISQETYAL